MKAEIVSIGTELLLGHIVNTNAAYLSQKLAETGIDVYYHTTVGDNPLRLAESINKALNRSDIVIMTGGLGPTVDDITVETVARLVNKRLVTNKAVLKDLNDYFKLKKIKTPPDSVRQALVPEGAKIIRNPVGTAPGLIMEYKDKVIICLPGPPRELEPMFAKHMIPYLKERSGSDRIIRSRLIKTTGLAESQVNAKVKDLLKLKPPTAVGIYAKPGEVALKIMAKAKGEKEALKNISKIERIINGRLKDRIFGYDDETLEEAVGKVLTKKNLTIATAESCTGGLIADRLTDLSGSSEYFVTGVVTYSNGSKQNMLGVSGDSLKKFGAVSKQVALEMAKGVRHFACADIGLGVTGIAGPTGATRMKPVGLVYIALVTGKKRIVKEFRFKGSRREIKFQSSQAALDLIRRNI